MRLFFATLTAVALTSCTALPFGSGDEMSDRSGIALSNGWASVAPVGVKQAAGFLTIANNTGQDDRLIAVASARAGRMELHEMGTEGSMTTMRQMKDGLAVPAGGSVTLKPTGNHLMFVDLTAPFSVGDTVRVTLTFEKAGKIEADLPVRTMAAMQ